LNANGQRQDALRDTEHLILPLKRSFGTRQDAGENLKEASTAIPLLTVDVPSPELPKKRRKRMPEWKVCQEFKDIWGKW